MIKYHVGWKQLQKARGIEFCQVNFQAPVKLRKEFTYICNSKNSTAEIEFNKLMEKFVKKHK